MGPVSAIGIGADEYWEGLAAGASGVDELGEPIEGVSPRRAARLFDFEVEEYLETTKNYLDRNSALAFGAARLALEQAGLPIDGTLVTETGLVTGTAYGNLETMLAFFGRALEKGLKLAPPILAPHTFTNTTNSLLAIEYGIRGFNWNFCSGMVAGMDAILAARDALMHRKAERVLSGGSEAFCAMLLRGCAAAGALATESDLDEDSRPFDRSRNGFVLGEGACFLLLETEASARAANRERLAEIVGAGQAGGNGEELDSSLARAMRVALTEAGVRPEDVGAILAAANSSQALDAAEARAIWDVFGDMPVPVTAVKSMLGETFGAGAPLAMCAAVLAMQEKIAPPTVNYERGDEELSLPGVSPNPQPFDLRITLVNAIDPGGACGAVVLRS